MDAAGSTAQRPSVSVADEWVVLAGAMAAPPIGLLHLSFILVGSRYVAPSPFFRSTQSLQRAAALPVSGLSTIQTTDNA